MFICLHWFLYVYRFSQSPKNNAARLCLGSAAAAPLQRAAVAGAGRRGRAEIVRTRRGWILEPLKWDFSMKMVMLPSNMGILSVGTSLQVRFYQDEDSCLGDYINMCTKYAEVEYPYGEASVVYGARGDCYRAKGTQYAGMTASMPEGLAKWMNGPRLAVDSSICGLNGRCLIPERSTLPTAKEILRSFPLRNSQECLQGFSLDVKAAHKRIVLHKEEQGLVGFSLDGKLYFYRVTPFGAVFSAFWWARLGGLLLRIFHHLIWWSHAGFLYVDDFLFFMETNMMPVSATLVCIFCQILGIS